MLCGEGCPFYFAKKCPFTFAKNGLLQLLSRPVHLKVLQAVHLIRCYQFQKEQGSKF